MVIDTQQDELDKELTRRGHRFIRYADDCSIFLRSKRSAYRVLRSIRRFIEEELRLLVNEDKTAIRRPVRFELLGYGFVSSFRKGEKGKYDLRVAPKSWQRLKLKIKAITRKTSAIPFEDRIQRLNSLMYGWLGYFQLGKIWGKLRTLDGWIRNRLRYCIWKQWKKLYAKWCERDKEWPLGCFLPYSIRCILFLFKEVK